MDRIKLGSVVLSVKELLEALRLKYPQFDDELRRPPQAAAQPWVKGRELVRCVCGTIKPAGKPCPGCGQ
jgi:hypothetical protein